MDVSSRGPLSVVCSFELLNLISGCRAVLEVDVCVEIGCCDDVALVSFVSDDNGDCADVISVGSDSVVCRVWADEMSLGSISNV